MLSRPTLRLLTLTGPGGIGKTRLALQVATDLAPTFPDGVRFVSLSHLRDPSKLVATIAPALGVKETPRHELTDAVYRAVADREVCLLLDNFEHLEQGAPQVADLLEHCPRLKVLVTSRVSLRLHGEHDFVVPGLALPGAHVVEPIDRLRDYSAIRLFIERARAVRSDFDLDQSNAASVVEICRRLDGLPLAIELAAARTKHLSLAEILERLADRFRLLTAGPRDVPPRQQTLWNTIAWSYDLLTSDEQQLFRRLTVFDGGFNLTAAEAVSGDRPTSVLDGLASLVDRSFLRHAEALGVSRYTMLETIREFGRVQLAASGDGPDAASLHAAHFLAVIEAAQLRYETDHDADLRWVPPLDLEIANFRAALHWCHHHDHARGLRLAIALGWNWVRLQHLVEGAGWLTTFLALAPADARARGRALVALATLLRDQGRVAEAQPLYEEARRLAEESADRWGIARCLIMLAYQANDAGDRQLVLNLAEQSLSIARELGSQNSILWALLLLMHTFLEVGDVSRARPLAEEARRIGSNSGALIILGRLARDDGEYDRAELLFREALTAAQAWNDASIPGMALHELGLLRLEQRELAEARHYLEERLNACRKLWADDRTGEVLYDLAYVDWAENNRRAASLRLVEGLTLAQRVQSSALIARGILIAGWFTQEQGHPALAVRFFAAAENIYPSIESRVRRLERDSYRRFVAAVQTALSTEDFSTAWARGQGLSKDQAIAEVQAFLTAAAVREPPSERVDLKSGFIRAEASEHRHDEGEVDRSGDGRA